MGPSDNSPVLITADARIRDAVLASAAALELEVVHTEDVADLPTHWARAERVLVGADLAEPVAASGLPVRAGVHVVAGDQPDPERWSMALAAPVLRVPQQQRLLPRALSDARGGAARPLVLLGAGGGLGVSTLAAGVAGAVGGPAVLVDLDVGGGGLDLLLGVEADRGWRWSELGGARGDVGTLAGRIPERDQVSVVAMGRQDPVEPPPGAVAAVLSAAGRDGAQVVVDAGRGLHPALLESDLLVVVGAHVRGLAAAQLVCDRLRVRMAGLVLRRFRPGGVTVAVAEKALRHRVVAEVPDVPRLAQLADQGAPPWAAGRRWRRACRQVLEATGQSQGAREP